MSTNAKIYAAVLLSLGFLVLAGAFADGWIVDGTRFASYLTLAVLSSALKVGLPGVAGSRSFAFIFVLIGMVDLTLPETLVIGVTCILIEGVWHPKRRLTLLQLLLSVANISLAIACANVVFNWSILTTNGITMPVRLAFAASVFFLVNTFAMSSLASLSDQSSLIRTWRESYFWSFPYYMGGAAIAWAFHAISETVGWPAALLVLPLAHLFHRTYSLHFARLEDGKKHAEQMASVHLRTIEALALAIEAKDNTTHDHLKRVQVYAMEMGRELGLNEDELEALRAAALLHDIGKLAVPEYIISKPGRLTPEEFEKMKIHTVVGAEILEHVQFPYPVVPIVRAHHEKWNGTGYPMGLRGTDIPIGARILSAVDALDALASDRQYRRALPLDEAMSKIELESGRSFDPAVVEILKRNHVELERKAQASNSIGVKLSTNLRIERGDAPATGFETANSLTFSTRGEESDFPYSAAIARRDMQEIFDVGLGSESPLNLDEIIAVLAVRLKKLIPFDAIALYSVEDDKLIPGYVSGDNYRLFSSLQIPMGQGLSGWVAENRKPIMNGNPSVEPGYLNDPNIFSTLRSALAVPLEGSVGIIGVLSLYHEGRDAFTREHLRLIQTIGPKLALSLELASKGAAEDPENPIDYLTGLPNAQALFLHLEAELVRCKRLSTSLGVMVCSVDGLKQVNQRLGRLEGDKTLRAVAAALKDNCSEFDYLARLSGDEFAVLMPGVRKDTIHAKIAKLMNASPRAGKQKVTLLAGQSSFPEDGADAEMLISEADRRMFQKKQQRDLAADAESRADEMNWLQ
jgi:diguanylate cyclase (GGDEF)-like protein/putative nucleotidyltransferase with HDIG domain